MSQNCKQDPAVLVHANFARNVLYQRELLLGRPNPNAAAAVQPPPAEKPSPKLSSHSPAAEANLQMPRDLAVHVEDAEIGLAAQPGELPLREAPVARLVKFLGEQPERNDLSIEERLQIPVSLRHNWSWRIKKSVVI